MNQKLDTEWRMSAKGNWWRQMNGKNIVVGRKRYEDAYWVLVDGSFLDGEHETLQDAQRSAEAEVA